MEGTYAWLKWMPGVETVSNKRSLRLVMCLQGTAVRCALWGEYRILENGARDRDHWKWVREHPPPGNF